MKKKLLAVFAGLGLLAADGIMISAFAGDLRVRCESRSNRRSKVSVDGNNVLAGSYTVVITSGGNKAQAMVATVGDQFEADFDSNRADILAGATPISARFLQSGSVSVQVTGPENLSATNVSCRVR